MRISYAPGEKVWLKSKYIKTKCNQKLEAKLIGLFRVLYPLDSQAYQFKLPKPKKINKVFLLFSLDQDNKKKRQVDEKIVKKLEFKSGSNSKEYKVEGICNSAVYAEESEVSYLSGLYHLVSWKI